MKKFLSLLVCAAISTATWSNPDRNFNNSMVEAQGARSLFLNPAALAFEAELNGPLPLFSATWGAGTSEGSLAMAYGALALGWERTRADAGFNNRWSLGSAIALHPQWFIGNRISLSASDQTRWAGLFEWDMGLQFRPNNSLGFGLLAEDLNGSKLSDGTAIPARYSAAALVRPLSFLELIADVATYSDAFGSRFDAQALVSVSPVQGFWIRAGYQTNGQWQAGIQWDFDRGRWSTSYRPSLQAGSINVQASPLPRRTALEIRSALLLEIDSDLSETRKTQFFGPTSPSLHMILEQLDEARRSNDIKTVALRIRNFPLGYAAAGELAQAVKFVAEKKPVTVYLANAGLREYWIASGAQKIVMEPSGELRWLGLQSERYFFKGTLDKIGIEGQFLAKGEYKSAPEMFTRKESSPLARETTMQYLRTKEGLLIEGLKARGIDRAKWDALLKLTLLSADEAKAQKLIDETEPWTTSHAALKDRYLVVSELEYAKNDIHLPDRIALVSAEGDILPETSRWMDLAGYTAITPMKLERAVHRAVQDPRVKAIVVRVNSPGGEVLASERSMNILEEARKKKPVIISMGDVAASGGYMIAAAGETIVASPMTATGSIGVFLGKFHLKGLFDKIDLHKERLTDAPNAGLYSEERGWSATERAVFQRRLDSYYDRFVQTVAHARHLSLEKAEKAAKGRVWLGEQAKQLGLVDQLGGLNEAIELAANKVDRTSRTIEVAEYGDDHNLWDLFTGGAMVSELFTSFPSLKEPVRAATMAKNPVLLWDPRVQVNE